jgi:4-hydroxybenzoate polyprenyltransferase
MRGLSGEAPIAGTRAAEVGALGWLRAVRARDWAHFALLPLAAYEPARGWEGVAAIARGVAIACFVLAYGYLLNAIADRRTDRPGKNPLAAGEVLDARAGVLCLVAAAVGASALGPPVVRLATAVCLVSGAAYSIGPRIKRIPVLGTVSNASSFAPLLWVGSVGDQILPWMPAVTLAFVCLLLQNQLLHEAADQTEDCAARVQTTVLWLGKGRAALLAGLFGAGLIAVALRAAGPAGAVLLAVVFVASFPLLLALHGRDASKMAWARRVHRVCALVTGAVLLAWLR